MMPPAAVATSIVELSGDGLAGYSAEQLAPCMNEREAAKFFSVSSELMRLWRRRGEGPRFYKIGGKLVRYALADLIAWKESQAGAMRA
jgi:predicted DNA-binding transcriptional regulator AlpA